VRSGGQIHICQSSGQILDVWQKSYWSDITHVVNFIKILRAVFTPIFLHQKITKPNCNQRKAVQNTLVQKTLRIKCDKIDTCCSQLHQYIMSSFCALIILSKNYKANTMCQFHQHKRTNFLYEHHFFTYMYLEKNC